MKQALEPLLEEARGERSFRQEIISVIGSLVRDPSTGQFLRVLIVVELVVILSMSMVFSVFLLHLGYAAVLMGAVSVNPPLYGYIISAQMGFGAVVSIPLVKRAGTTEQAHRFDDSLQKISKVRHSQRPAHAS